MKIILFGASGMVGQGVLRECLRDPAVTNILSVGRTSLGLTERKLREIVHADLFDLTPIEASLTGFDACFFTLGMTVVGKTEADYTRVTYDLTLAVAQTLTKLNPILTFVYVSGQGTDSTERGRVMWARVKGRTENALLRLPFKASYMFRPALIQPLHGIRSKTVVYRIFYTLTAPFIPFLTARWPQYATTTEQVGRAMLGVAHRGFPKPVLESRDINSVT